VSWDIQGPPKVGVVGGSRSDFPVLEKACAVLMELEIASESWFGTPSARSRMRPSACTCSRWKSVR